ncbi:MAG: prolyl oligopeptidase family serine peptidase [Anaerolineaceae bacterium]
MFYQVIHHCADDVTRLLDYLSADPCADIQSCGITGHSMGAYTAYLIFANIPVFRAGVPMNGVPTFTRRWTDILDESRFSNLEWEKALEENFEESQSLLQLIRTMDPAEKLKSSFPKALFLMNNDFDSDQPKIYAVDMYRDLLPYYASEPDRLKLNIYPGGHMVTSQMMMDALEWFRQFLPA